MYVKVSQLIVNDVYYVGQNDFFSSRMICKASQEYKLQNLPLHVCPQTIPLSVFNK